MIIFYNTHFKKTLSEIDIEHMQLENMTQILDYLATTVLTSVENNIIQHFSDYINKTVDVLCQKNEIADIKDKKEREKQYRKLARYKNWIKTRNRAKLPKILKDHYDVMMINRPFMKNKEGGDTCLKYDLKCRPQDYLPLMMDMMALIESKNTENNYTKLYCVFPSRESLIPGYVQIDTTTLINHFICKDSRKLKGCVNDAKSQWKKYFNLSDSCFKMKHYKFNHSIHTDGIGCSISFIREDLYGKTKEQMKKILRK